MVLINLIAFSFCSGNSCAEDKESVNPIKKAKFPDKTFPLLFKPDFLISADPKDFSKPLFYINSEYMTDGIKKYYFREGMEEKLKVLKNTQPIVSFGFYGSGFEFISADKYPFISIGGSDYKDSRIKYDEDLDGILKFKYNGQTLYLKPDYSDRHAGVFRAFGGYKLGSDSYISVASNESVPISLDPNDFSKPVFVVTRDYITDGTKKYYFREIMKDKINELKNYYEPGTGGIIFYDFPFITIGLKENWVGIKFDDFNEKVMSFKYNGKTLYLKLEEESKKWDYVPRAHYSYIFYKASEQKELDEKLSKIPEFQLFINELRDCVKKKSEQCFYEHKLTKNELQQRKAKGENSPVVNTKLKISFLLSHIFAFPKAYEYFQNHQFVYTEPPAELLKLIDVSKSKTWDWIDVMLTLTLKDNYFVKLESTNLRKGINRIGIRIEGSDMFFSFVKKDSGWVIGSMLLPNHEGD